MKIAVTISALALSLAPVAAFSQGCIHDQVKEETASSCVVGYTWDEAKGTCIATPSS